MQKEGQEASKERRLNLNLFEKHLNGQKWLDWDLNSQKTRRWRQNWFGALLNGPFERFVSEYKTIQPNKYSC